MKTNTNLEVLNMRVTVFLTIRQNTAKLSISGKFSVHQYKNFKSGGQDQMVQTTFNERKKKSDKAFLFKSMLLIRLQLQFPKYFFPQRER